MRRLIVATLLLVAACGAGGGGGAAFVRARLGEPVKVPNGTIEVLRVDQAWRDELDRSLRTVEVRACNRSREQRQLLPVAFVARDDRDQRARAVYVAGRTPEIDATGEPILPGECVQGWLSWRSDRPLATLRFDGSRTVVWDLTR